MTETLHPKSLLLMQMKRRCRFSSESIGVFAWKSSAKLWAKCRPRHYDSMKRSNNAVMALVAMVLMLVVVVA